MARWLIDRVGPTRIDGSQGLTRNSANVRSPEYGIESILWSMVKPESRKVWLFLLILVGVLGFFADSADQSTMAPRGLTAADDDREDGAGEAESAPAQEAIATSAAAVFHRRWPGAALAVPRQGVRIAASKVNAQQNPSDLMRSSTPPSLLELRI